MIMSEAPELDSKAHEHGFDDLQLAKLIEQGEI